MEVGIALENAVAEIGYEAHLRDGEDSEKLAASRWTNVLDFVDWIAKRCGGQIENDGGATFESEKKTSSGAGNTLPPWVRQYR